MDVPLQLVVANQLPRPFGYQAIALLTVAEEKPSEFSAK